METSTQTSSTAYGAADAPALGSQGAGEKWTTGRKIKFMMLKSEIHIAT